MIKFLMGRQRKLVLPNGEEHKAFYAIVDLNDIKASHNEITFADTIGYPTENGRNINDRNYKDDISAQRNVQKIAENLKPENLISLSSTPSGTPIINEEGIVVSGNNRVMSLKLAVKQYPKNYEEYKKQLAEDIDIFGFEKNVGVSLLMNDVIILEGSSFYEPKNIKFEYPVLVRIDESLPEKLNTEVLAAYNQDTKKGERPVDKAIKLSSILNSNERCKNAILHIVDGYDTFSDLYSSAGSNDRKKLIENFVQCGLIPEAQLPTYYDNGEFTEIGKDYIETLLSSIILSPDALKVSGAEGVKRLRQIIISSLPLLVTNESLKDGSLKKYISEAIVIQYKISKLGDFKDYVRTQTLFDEEKFDVKSLYINALLRQGRNDFKNSIRRYNESAKSNEGAMLFMSEKLGLDEIFKLTIIDSVDSEDNKLIQSLHPLNLKNTTMVENITDLQTEEILLEPVQAIEEDNMDLFMGDNWYKNNPDKILGIAYESSGRFGKVTKYSGDMQVLSRIDVDENFIGVTKAIIDPLASISDDMNLSAEILQPENNEFVKDVIEKSFGELEQKKKSTKVKIEEEAAFTPIKELNSFKTTFENINPEITKEEVEVYTWYKSSIGKPLSRNYVSLFKDDDYFTDEEKKNMRATHIYKVGDNKIEEWVKNGLLFYYRGQLYPKFEYISGNMYTKKMDLESEKSEIVRLYGEDVYNNQVLVLNEAFQLIYQKRLTIGGENSLVVLANSKLAKEFKISTIQELPEDKKWKILAFGTAENYGKPDLIKDLTVYSEYKKTEYDEISLQDAFGWYLLNKKPLLKEPITHLDIYKYYVLLKPIRITPESDSPEAKKKAEAQREKLKSSTQREGERLFADFLQNQLVASDKIRLETQWNVDFNNYLPIDLNKVPVSFTMAKMVYGFEEKVKPEKRDAVAFTMSNGTGILSYDVGVGKTPSAIFTISAFLDAGYCKRPAIVLPNQVYKQFIADFKEFAPHIPIIEAYNLSKDYVDNLKNAKGEIENVPEGCVTVMTYEGFELIGFNEETSERLVETLYQILNQGGESEKSEKKKAGFRERVEETVGKGLKGGMFSIEDFGFDFMCYDEAHAMKKVFTSVKGEAEEDEKGDTKRGKNPYEITSGSPSTRGLKGFMINYYILEKNGYKNILLLTATPFTNSPLEIFSMLAMVAFETLRNQGLDNLKTFFDTYVQTSTSLVINTKLKPVFKQVILGFNNLVSLQSLIRRYILYKTGEEVGVKRPKKYVLPYTHELENGIVIDVPEERRVETYIPMTEQQKSMMDDIINYVENGGSLGDDNFDDLKVAEPKDAEKDEDETKDETSSIEVSESDLSDKEKRGVRTIKGLSYSRNLALSPYLYEFSGLGKPDYKSYIEKSPKLYYVMKCVKSVRDYNLSNNQKVAGQVIYMDRGIEYFNLIKEYLVKEIGYGEHEVGIIKSGLPKSGTRSKEYVKNLFNGEIYNEKTKTFDVVDDFKRIKVVIGSSTIKEGMNLQKYGAVLYNCFIDWNPTDIQQLEGRIYRQKNTFESVRIVNPLVVDSADIFLFQKLQEKTSRLNTIWSTDGQSNVLNTQEFNPEELKYALIRNPEVIAELKIIERDAYLQSELLSYNRQLEIADKVKETAFLIKNKFKDVASSLEKYRNFQETGDLFNDAQKLVALAIDAEKNQTDKEGKKILYSWQKNDLSSKIQKLRTELRWNSEDEKKQKELSKLENEYNSLSILQYGYNKPYYFSDFSLAVRDLKRYFNDFIKQYNIDFDIQYPSESLQVFKDSVQANIEKIQEEIKNLRSEENKKILIQDAIEEKERQKVTYKDLPALISDFSKLNFLLDNKVVEDVPKKVYTSCPPLEDDNKTFAIDDEAIRHLTMCLEKEPQTKELYWSEISGYTPERLKVHDKIINDLFENVKCVKSDKQPIAIFTGGSPASGKSTFINKNAEYLTSENIFHLDADAIRAELPEYKGWNANSTHLETQDIVTTLLDRIGSEQCRYDFIYDGTMNKAKKYFPLIQKAKELGYKTYIIFMDVPYAEAKKRVLSRYKKTGRFVPSEVIDDFFTKIGDKTKGQAALDELKPLVDGYIVVDSMTNKVIEKGGEGLPEGRDSSVYGKPLLSLPKQKQEVVIEEVKTEVQPDTNKLIKSLEIALKFSDEENKKIIEKQIKVLILSLKYKKDGK